MKTACASILLVCGALATGAFSPAWGASLCAGPRADYVIITTSDLVAAFDGYVNTKNAAGIATTVCAVSDILANYAGADTQEKIRNYILDAYATWGISYVLLGGDESHIPVRTYSGICDKYYFDLDAQPYFGGVTVLGGRLPGATFSQTQKIANQWAAYDGSAAWTRNMLYCTWAGDELAGLAKFSGTLVPGEGDYAIQIMNQINPGRGMVAYFGHGFEGGWSSCSLNYVNVQSLANGNKLPVVVAGACSTGILDAAHCMAEDMFNPPSGGILAYIGANKVIYLNDGSGVIDAMFNELKTEYFDTGRFHPCAAYYLGVNTSDFNYLGDPTAVMDFRLAGDLTPPSIVSQQVGPGLVTAYQYVSAYATLTDNDEVSSNVWLAIQRPDATVATVTLARTGYSGDFSGLYANTDLAGTYTCTLHARDISGNERVSALPMTFTVQTDLQAPVVSGLCAAPAQAYPYAPVQVTATVTDNSGANGTYALTVTGPDHGTCVYAGPSWGTLFMLDITCTAKAGRYQASVHFTDPSGNATPEWPVVNFPPTDAFEILADTQAPVIAQGWVTTAGGMGMPPSFAGDKRLFSTPVGSMITVWEDATDNVTATWQLQCQSAVRLPDHSAVLLAPMMWAGTGMYPPGTGYNTMPYTVTQPGFYHVTVSARDQVGNLSLAYGGFVNAYAAATGLTANAVSNQVNLAWLPARSGYPITGYNIFRNLSPLGNTLTPINVAPVVQAQYQDAGGLVNGTTYYYQVAGIDSAGNTCGNSLEISAVPTSGFAPSWPPLEVTALPGDHAVTLSWSAAVPGTCPVAGYWVFRGVSSQVQDALPINGALVAAQTYTDNTAQNGVRYYYKIKAQDSGNTLSAFSGEVQAQPAAFTPTPVATSTRTATVTPAITPTQPVSALTPTPTPTPTAVPKADLHGQRVLAYPNPARDQVRFAWDEAEAETVAIRIYNLAGEQVAMLRAPGLAGEAVWDCSRAAPGIYLFQTVLTVQGREVKLPVKKIARLR